MDANPAPHAVMADMGAAASAPGSAAVTAQARHKAGNAPSHTVHLVGQLTDVVFSFLGPATAALAAVGHRQTVVVMEDPRFAYLPGEFSPSVDLLVIKNDTRWRRWREALPLFWRVLKQGRPSAVHFHGFIPLLLGGALMYVHRAGIRMYYSPHGSKAHFKPGFLRRRLVALAHRLMGAERLSTIIAANSAEATDIPGTFGTSEIAYPIADVFLKGRKLESPTPLVIAGNSTPNSSEADKFAQLSTILSGGTEGIGFQWLSSKLPERSMQALKAASVQTSIGLLDAQRADLLKRGWVYLATGNTSGFTVHLAEAMASGLACVAEDTPAHRALIDHGITGFLYQTDDEAINLIARLTDDAELRHRVGREAQNSATKRQTISEFNDIVRQVYRTY